MKKLIMRILQKTIGYLLIASPFILLGVICFRSDMLEDFIVAFASVILVALIALFGFYLIES